MVPFTVEEENLICMYHKSDRRRTAANIRAALPDMDEDMAAFQSRNPLMFYGKIIQIMKYKVNII